MATAWTIGVCRAYLLAGLCLFILIFALLAHRLTIKPLAILLTILSATVTYFIAKYGVAIDSSMILNAVHTDSTEVGQLLSLQMLPYGVILMVAAGVAHPVGRHHVCARRAGTCWAL